MNEPSGDRTYKLFEPRTLETIEPDFSQDTRIFHLEEKTDLWYLKVTKLLRKASKSSQIWMFPFIGWLLMIQLMTQSFFEKFEWQFYFRLNPLKFFFLEILSQKK